MSRLRWVAFVLLAVSVPLAVVAFDAGFDLPEPVEPWASQEFLPGYANRTVEGGEWRQLFSIEPDLMVTSGDRVAASFPGAGLWLYEDGNWTRLTPATPYALTFACRNVVAAFDGAGLYIHDGTDWAMVHPLDPVSIQAKGNTGILVGFEPSPAIWEYKCPASIACAFLDGSIWNLDEDPQSEDDDGPRVVKFRLDGNRLYKSIYEDLLCQGEDEEWHELQPDCTVVQSDSGTYSVGGDCTATWYEGNWGQFAEDRFFWSFQEPTFYEGSNCPEDEDYRGGAWGLRCDPEVCWPCD